MTGKGLHQVLATSLSKRDQITLRTVARGQTLGSSPFVKCFPSHLEEQKAFWSPLISSTSSHNEVFNISVSPASEVQFSM